MKLNSTARVINTAQVTARALGEPEWWVDPGNTGQQLLESGTFAAEIMNKSNHVQRFILDACCNQT